MRSKEAMDGGTGATEEGLSEEEASVEGAGVDKDKVDEENLEGKLEAVVEVRVKCLAATELAGDEDGIKLVFEEEVDRSDLSEDEGVNEVSFGVKFEEVLRVEIAEDEVEDEEGEE